MLVKQLIKELENQDPDYEVRMDTPYESVISCVEADDNEKSVWLIT
jgi:hypothetical protein